jgi:uncharacterized protein YyaL (SSP411 family)
MPNRLASERSPYLLQHKDNPVDWYPWGEEAFERARREDKPIFLSIGYSTCHWCHVMERESFENPDVAQLLNRDFVSIKVDREERPDIDRVYMTFVQVTTGSGGWPMSVWLTPSLEPFYGGTYFPPTSRWGRPGFVEVLQEIARLWREEREKVARAAAAMVERLRTLGARGGGAGVPAPTVLERATAEFAAAFDRRRGGFGDAPKFPRPCELLFLLREHARTGARAPLDMVTATLHAMALGGMRDHVGGGFHRYSVDGDWRVPHFEKMLYDQAQLVLAYLEAWQATGVRFFANVALDTLEYVRRDLTGPDGEFHSAEDADSVPPEHAGDECSHKAEGAFYVWSDAEIGDVLGADAEVFRLRYGVLPGGNVPHDPQGEFKGKNILYTARTIEEVAALTGRSVDEVEQALARSRAALQARRSTRPRPHLDDKVLTAWNGLAIAAFARAARVLPGARAFLTDAQRAAALLRDRLWRPETGTLLRCYRQGESGVEAYAEDYACLTFGLLELFQADGHPQWLEWALTLQQRLDDLFWDPEEGGWFSTTGQDKSVLLRLKEDYDGAEPAASSVAVLNLLLLAHLVGDDGGGYSQRVMRTFGAFALCAAQAGRTVPMMLASLSTYHAGIVQIVLAGDPESPDTVALRGVLESRYLPNAVVVPVAPGRRDALVRLLPWVADLRPREGRATAYVCRDFTCRLPATSAEELASQLG